MDVGLDDRTLRRTAALLVALAVLAERAAGSSFPVRWFVLTILRYAEIVARVYVLDLTQCEWPGFDEDLEPGCQPHDAALLAWRLRVLAALLVALLSPDGHRFGETAHIVRMLFRSDGAAPRLARLLPATSGGWTLQAPDTS